MKIIPFTLFIATCSLTIASEVRYDNFTLYRLIPKSLSEVNILTDLETSHLGGYDFWTHPKDVGVSVDVLVSPDKKSSIKDMMNSNNIQYEVVIENVQEKIEEEAKLNEANFKGGKVGFSWTSYARIDQIYDWLIMLSSQYPRIVTVIEGGRTSEGRRILGVKLSFQPGNERRGVWLDSLIHAREWIAGATTTFILNELLTSTDPGVREVADNHDWYIFPVINPDGYEYTHTTNRLWRKTRKQYGVVCYGADPNRNWGFRWNTGGSSSQPCSDTYAGPNSFSEIETDTLSRYLRSIGQNLVAYISFHSYSQMILLPYGHTARHLDNYNQVRGIGLRGAQSLAKRYGTQYVVGNVAETIYVATGSSMDWVKDTLKVPVALTYELRDKGNNGFLLPADQIIPSGLETLDSLVTILLQTDRLLLNRNRTVV